MATPYRTHRDSSVDKSNQVVKIGEGEVAYLQVTNGGTVDAYFHLYDGLTADVTVGTTTPIATFLVPAGAGTTQVGAYEFSGPPIHFEKGIVYAATTTFGGSTDPTAKPALGLLQFR